jgi:asparagine synthase (glutamine-hydrolysing)
MLGVYCRTDRPAEDLAEFAALRALAAGREPVVRGPLAVTALGQTGPSWAQEGALTCVIDGALYEPDALARTLGSAACADAGLVARAYDRLGADAFTRLRGRFAVAVWDETAGVGALTSDLLATRELFFASTAGATVFATELRDLLGLLPSRPAPDPVGFGTWLGEGTCPADRTLYDGVFRLRAGELLALQTRSAQQRRYWRPRPEPAMTGSRAQLVDGLRAQLERAIGKRLSQRSSAVILSGGLDSSVVTAVAGVTRPRGAGLRTYSAVFPGEDYDETAKIRQVNARTGIAPGAIEIAAQGTLWLALRHTQSWQLPLIAAGSLIDIAATAEASRDGADVVLDGQTGDELFGLSPYLLADRIRHGRLLSAIALADQWPIGRRTSVRNKVWLIKELGLKGAAPHRLGRFVQGRRDDANAGPPWLAPPLRRAFAAREDRWAWKRAASGPLWWRFYSDTLIDAPHREFRLEYLRHRAATEGIVSEPPLYDPDLIGYCLRLPPELAFDRRFDRPLVREAMCHLLPDDVRLQTQKADFTRFCERALVTADAPGIARLLTDPDALIGDWADLTWVRSSWGRIAAGEHHPGWLSPVWRITAAEVWLRAQADPEFIDTALAQPDVPAPSVRRVALD